MKIGLIRNGTPIARAIWTELDDTVKLVLLANGQVQIDDDGLPRVADEVLATVIADVERALGLRKAVA